MAFSLRRKKRDDVIVDRLTGAFNRRQLDRDIAAGLDTSEQPTATLLVDVDGFGEFTGKKGATSGNQVLERVSWVIMATVRTTDVVYRPGESTFCVLLPATSDVDAKAVADRIRGNVEKMPLLAESDVTVSIGVATGTSTTIARTIERADRALTAGASSGINRVFEDPECTASSLPEPVTASPMLTGNLASPVHLVTDASADPATPTETSTPTDTVDVVDSDPTLMDATPRPTLAPPAPPGPAAPPARSASTPNASTGGRCASHSETPSASIPLTPPTL